MDTISEFAHEATLRRTLRGAREVIADRSEVEPAERRLLTMLTGYTPVAVLAECLAMPSDLVSRMAANLVACDLAEVVAEA